MKQFVVSMLRKCRNICYFDERQREEMHIDINNNNIIDDTQPNYEITDLFPLDDDSSRTVMMSFYQLILKEQLTFIRIVLFASAIRLQSTLFITNKRAVKTVFVVMSFVVTKIPQFNMGRKFVFSKFYSFFIFYCYY